MTVSYSRAVATLHHGSLLQILFRWRGSVYKAVWPTFIAFSLAYALVSIIYYTLPTDTLEQIERKRKFVQICAYVGHMSDAIPVSFVLGFFVNVVVGRWWKQFLNLPTPDYVCLLLTTFLRGDPKSDVQPSTNTDRPKLFRRTITRYLNLSCALCFYTFSLSLRRQITTLAELVYCGLMTAQERQIYQHLAQDNDYFFIPLAWAISLLTKAHHEGMIRHERHLDAMVTAVVQYWQQLQTLFLHDYVNIPLVYNQVVTLVVYVYLGTMVLSHQFSDPVNLLKKVETELQQATNSSALSGNAPDLTTVAQQLNVVPNVPVFALLMLVFYTGWLRVAETNVFPFGEDDDDFEVIPLLERNISTSWWFAEAALDTESEIIDLLQPVEKFGPSWGPGGDLEPTTLSESISEEMNQEAMGGKIAQPTSPGTEEALPIRRGTTVLAPVGEELTIPELPCPSELRRRSSKYFFAGSMTRLHEEEIASHGATPTRHLSMAGQSDSSRPPWTSTVGSLVGRVGRRISEALAPNTSPTVPFATAAHDQFEQSESPGTLPKRE